MFSWGKKNYKTVKNINVYWRLVKNWLSICLWLIYFFTYYLSIYAHTKIHPKRLNIILIQMVDNDTGYSKRKGLFKSWQAMKITAY